MCLQGHRIVSFEQRVAIQRSFWDNESPVVSLVKTQYTPLLPRYLPYTKDNSAVQAGFIQYKKKLSCLSICTESILHFFLNLQFIDTVIS